jgi:hypothetical protein
MQAIANSPAMDSMDLSEKVELAIKAVDDFIAFLKTIAALKPFVDDLEPNDSARICSYAKSLAKSLVRGSIQEPQGTSNIGYALEKMRDTVRQLIEEIRPLLRTPCTDQDNPETCKSQVFFVTDRVKSVDREYSGAPESTGRLDHGKVEVSIPEGDMRGGKLKEPQTTDPQNYLEPFFRIISDPASPFRDINTFFRELNEYINEKALCPDVLLYIPGFGSHLTKGLRQLAKLKKDLDFEGAVILYSWPSAGSKWAYYSDEQTVFAATPLLSKFIVDLQRKVLDEYNLLVAAN